MKKFLVYASVPIVLVLTSCGGGSNNVNDIGDLPNATAPVFNNTLSTSSVDVATATTGLVLANMSTSSFDTNSSRAMCEVANVTKESVGRASGADQVMCYVKNVITNTANEAAVSALGTNIYDGNYHVFTLDFTNNPYVTNTAPKIKMKISKDGDSISRFEMFMCFAGTPSAPTQSEYILYSFDGDEVDITSKSTEGSEWKQHLTVSGSLNDSNQFTSKQITAVNYWNDTWGTGAQKAEFEQYSNAMEVSAYRTGSWVDGSNTGNDTEKVFSRFEILGANSLATFAIGDGTLKLEGSNTGTYDGSSYSFPFSETQAWSGDTAALVVPASSGVFYSNVSATAVPATDPTAEAVAIAFGASEAWDCTGASETTLVVDQANLDTACAAFGFNNHDWVNCWEIIDRN